jgi:hypothetical protein
MAVIKKSRTDSSGGFDFGPMNDGHYTLVIDDGPWKKSDWLDVEIKNLRRPTDSVTIDISPTSPDCKGGHKFTVNVKRLGIRSGEEDSLGPSPLVES